MGDLQVCSPRHHVVLTSDDCSFPRLSTLLFPTLNSDPSLIPADNWTRAENTIYDILRRIRPTLVAERKREEIIDFVQGLIRNRIGCEVFSYGSMPLKTYLPDGDIDLTALCCSNIENSVVSDVHDVLKGQEICGVSQYEVKDVHCIDAEVKLVKCIVQNIVVDISFNQLGGLCTLCFLEKVDRLVGKDHLFKRSIILIKAWCYYESRILGAHHGLISTYALETLVLYIFHLFHNTLNGPLAVLHKFLEYFSKFDWENYCLSLHGPVRKSSLPDIVAEVPENGGHELLLSEDFLRNCMDTFSVSFKGSDPSWRAFSLKHLNIIDPLKENNNLGRSVNRGNFYRIRSAFKYGARKLGWILLLPEERIEAELNNFFANTLDRHCWANAQFPDQDARNWVPVHSSALPLESCFKDKVCLESTLGFRDENTLGSEVSFPKVTKHENAVISTKSGRDDSPDFSSMNAKHFNVAPKYPYWATQNGILGLLGNQKIGNWSTSCQMTSDCVHNVQACTFCEVELKDESVVSNGKRISSDGSRSVSDVSANPSSGIDENETGAKNHVVGNLLDLCGDYDSFIRNLKYGQVCDSYALSPMPLSPPMSPHVQKDYPWEAINRLLLCNGNTSSSIDRNGFTIGPQSNLLNPFALVTEEKKRPQGIGTYFPRTNGRSYRDRQPQAKGKAQGHMTQSQFHRHNHSNKYSFTPVEIGVLAEGSHELSEAEFPILGSRKAGSPDSPPTPCLSKCTPDGNGSPWPMEELQSLPISPEPWGPAIPELIKPSEKDTSHLLGSSSCIGLSARESQNTEAENHKESVPKQCYHLKNDEDFPPLSH